MERNLYNCLTPTNNTNNSNSSKTFSCLKQMTVSTESWVLALHQSNTHINFQLIQFIVLLITPTQMNTSSYRD